MGNVISAYRTSEAGISQYSYQATNSAIGVQFPVGQDTYLRRNVQTGPGVHTGSYPMGKAFLRGQRGQGVKPTTHLHVVPRLRMNRAVHPPTRFHLMVFVFTVHNFIQRT
jgi:hypothetical protein